MTPIGFFAFLAMLAWVLVVSILLAREPAGTGAGAGGPPPASPGAP